MPPPPRSCSLPLLAVRNSLALRGKGLRWGGILSASGLCLLGHKLGHPFLLRTSNCQSNSRHRLRCLRRGRGGGGRKVDAPPHTFWLKVLYISYIKYWGRDHSNYNDPSLASYAPADPASLHMTVTRRGERVLRAGFRENWLL